MARPLRIVYSGAVYHVTSRGNERRPIFRDDEDRSLFLKILRNVNKRFNWLCHGYTLMNNHYHLIIETLDGNLSQGMRQLNGVYTQTFNRRHKRAGHIFQGRYKAVLIQKDSHLLEVCRYVVLNPVRAKAVKSSQEWRWSSYGATAGVAKPHPCLTTGWILSQFGKKAGVAQKQYKRFVQEGMGTESIWKCIRGQILLGGDNFTERFKGFLEGYEDIKEIPKSQRLINRPRLGRIFKSIHKGNRRRNGKIQEAVEQYGYSQKEVANYLHMHYSTISRILKTATISKNKT